MKWLIVINKYLPDAVGGNIIYVKRFIEELNNFGRKVILVTTTNDKILPKHEKQDNCEIYRVFFNKGNLGPLRFKEREIFTKEIEELIKKEEIDILNIHQGGWVTNKFLEQKREYKLIFTFHAVHSYELFFEFIKSIGLLNFKSLLICPIKYLIQLNFELNSLKYADKIVVMSDYVKGTVRKFLGSKYLNKVFVTGIGVSSLSNLDKVDKNQGRKKLKLNKDEVIFITVRRLAHRMGLFNLIKAFGSVNDDSARLLIIGKGYLYDKLDNYIKKLNLQHKVQLLGFVNNEDLHYYYCSSDCFILPTEELEGFGIATIEALSYNLPVIGTPKGATPEILSKFDSNLITKTHKSGDIAEKINYYLQNTDKYKDIDFDGKVQSIYNWGNFVNKIVNEI